MSVRRLVGLGTDSTEDFTGTGFIADAKKGIVVTNQHISGNSPLSKVELTFFNGESAEAKLLYFDPWHDFSFFVFDPSKVSTPLSQASFGTHSDLHKGEEVMLIGNSSGEGIGVKLGPINNLCVDKAQNPLGRHSQHFHTSLPRAGGASGSPLFDSNGRVIGLHTSGDENESFELRIDYVTDALKQILSGSFPKRGDLGVALDLIETKNAINYLKYPRELWDQAKKIDPETRNVIAVSRIAPDGPASTKLLVGDILVAISGRPLGQDLYGLDREVDGLIGKTIHLAILRNGKIRHVDVPVIDAQDGLPQRFALYAGAIFHDVMMMSSIDFNIPRYGVFMSQASPGTSFEHLGSLVNETVSNRRVVVYQIDDTPTPNLSAFIDVVRSIHEGEKKPVWVCDVFETGLKKSCGFVDIDFTTSPLRVFHHNSKNLLWEEESH